jgi:Domain of unknown function (DUF4114)/PEP-CTERM motif
VKTKVTLLVIAILALPAFLCADVIPYGNIGAIAPSSSFVASHTGPVVAYFYGSDAGYTSEIGLMINGVSTGIFGLPNHSSDHGDTLLLGNAHAGDTLVFELFVFNTQSFWYSDPSLNSDEKNHTYSTHFSGDSEIPAGTYVAFEDLPNGGTDWDYNDHQFVFTNAGRRCESTPEPASAMLLAGGLGMLGLLKKRSR